MFVSIRCCVDLMELYLLLCLFAAKPRGTCAGAQICRHSDLSPLELLLLCLPTTLYLLISIETMVSECQGEPVLSVSTDYIHLVEYAELQPHFATYPPADQAGLPIL